ncbi:HGGxSTG domain-containing protein [Acinetobacter ursingii]|uniref:HGGxSTG domain-containing protein n=1 Tax=Acinetobacter ursingii TaxID=108980 RepID=UPI00124BDEF1|nr:HGGxSTG domain-containing protein [Acinetobacter ursingii]
MSDKCGAKTRTGSKCKHPAGYRTDHVGKGKCYLHGGASKGAPKGNKNAQKHGIYSRIYDDEELDAAKDMQGSIETELAIARIQLANLLKWHKNTNDAPVIDRVEETTIVQEGKEGGFLEDLQRSAREAGEEYDPDGDEDLVREKESEVFSRKRIYQRRDFINEFTRLTALIARLEQQLVQMCKTKAEIKQIEAGEREGEDEGNFTDAELVQEIQELIEGFTF